MLVTGPVKEILNGISLYTGKIFYVKLAKRLILMSIKLSKNKFVLQKETTAWDTVGSFRF